ncbi:MAG: type VI secretion system ATPase TssH, partial [Cytophagaceae bacterium]|nr:type VI secretion system ATPase TssH [Cytophagaceae bacterium]
MNFNQYTIKAQEVIQHAAQMAQAAQQQTVETGHVLKALLEEDPETSAFLLRKVNAAGAPGQPQMLSRTLEAITSGYPKVSGSGAQGQTYLSNDLNAALAKAQSLTKEFGDEFVSVELLWLGIAAGKDTVATLLKDNKITENGLKTAIKELRGKNNPVNDQNAEAKYRSLERYSINLNQLAQQGKIDPVIGRDEEIRRVLQI